MTSRALILTAILCSSAAALSGCTQPEEKVLAKLTVAKSGALVTSEGRQLRARERAQYAGFTLELLELGDNQRLERLVSDAGEVVRERQGRAQECNSATQENEAGDDCTVFTDDEGNEVANSCAVPDADANDVHCERLDTFSDAGEPLICAVCYDANGEVVTRECHPAEPGQTEPCTDADQNCQPPEPWPCDDAAGTNCEPPPTCDATNDPDCLPPPVEECWVVGQGDMTCRVCTTATGETYEECYPNPDPNHCEQIHSDDGLLCTYCYNEAGEVVERFCEEPPCNDSTDPNCLPPDPTVCEEFVTPDGSFCVICYDEMGNAIERRCEEEPPPPTECREYHEPNGRVCVICTTADGDIATRECSEPGCDQIGAAIQCAADADCPAGMGCLDGLCDCHNGTEPCRLFETANGFLCEICGDVNGDGVEDLNDAFCYPRPDDPIFCEEIPTQDGQHCVICYAPDGTVVEERCEGEPEPPRCVVQGSAGVDDAANTGEVCEICYDDAGNVIYNSCSNVQCWVEELEENGQLVICEVCADENGEVSRFCHGGGCDPTNPNTDCPPPPMYCEELQSSDGQICVICYDEAGQVIEERCDEPGTGVCTLEERPSANGDLHLCEVCYGPNGEIVSERCEPAPPPMHCEEVQDAAGMICWICYDDAGNVVEEHCEGEPPPQHCEEYETSDGQLCVLCYDQSGQIISDECHPMQCWTEDYVEGGQLFLCDVCATASGELIRECRPLCDDSTNCMATTTAFIDPIQCGGNPWEQGTPAGSNSDEVMQVRAWLESLGVVVYNIRFERVYDQVCEACDCPRGDRLFIETDEEGMHVLAQFGFFPA